jgi:ABC-type multidrug transport system ATPase subunit
MSASPPAIEAAGLGRDYGSTRALDSLDLVVAPGVMVGVLGPNGAGKTTAMLLLATLLKPSRGTASIFGHNLAREATTIGLRTRSSQPVRQLSGGLRRLTDIARATVHRPDLLILDEPTVGLDPEHRDRVWGLLETERRERGVTILFSTHYLSEAESRDRVVLLAHGRVVAADTPAALMSTVGDEVVEIEGPDAERAARALNTVATVHVSIRTERGYRLGISGPRGELARTVGATPRITRFSIRPATLEDVYFARTQGADVALPDSNFVAKAI